MAEFADVVRRRRMTRSFDDRSVPAAVLADLVDLASRAPSAGKTQGWHVVALLDHEVASFWDITLPLQRRESFTWQRLLDAPVILVVFADPQAYVDRYGEPDKQSTGLGAGSDSWPTPYWTVDASMAVMTLLLAAEDAGLGALFFGVFRGEAELRRELHVPDRLQLLGAIALGYRSDPAVDSVAASDQVPGRSANRPRRPPGQIIHRRRW